MLGKGKQWCGVNRGLGVLGGERLEKYQNVKVLRVIKAEVVYNIRYCFAICTTCFHEPKTHASGI